MSGRIQPRTRVKICGIGRMQDAIVAVDAGVDALGFIFYKKSPRYIVPENAARIIASIPLFVDRVGVFVDATVDDVVECAQRGLTCVQLHGTESVEYCKEIRLRLPFLQIIKAFRVGDNSTSKLFSSYHSCVDSFLLDTFVQGEKGGTGRVFDWSIIQKLCLQRPVILAGGLSVANVLEAISDVKPYAVDINSGVEDRPGVKNHHMIKEILNVVALEAARMVTG